MQAQNGPRRPNFRRRTVSPHPQSQQITPLSDQLSFAETIISLQDSNSSSEPQTNSQITTAITTTALQSLDGIPLSSLQTPPQSKGKEQQQDSQMLHYRHVINEPVNSSSNTSPPQQPTPGQAQGQNQAQQLFSATTSSSQNTVPYQIASSSAGATNMFLSPCSSQSSARSSLSMNSPVQIRINPATNSARRSLNYEISMIQEKRFEDERNAINYAEKILSHKLASEKQTPSFKKQTQSTQHNNTSGQNIISSPLPFILTTNNLSATSNLQSLSTNPQSIVNFSNSKITSIFPQSSPQPSPHRSRVSGGSTTPVLNGILKKKQPPQVSPVPPNKQQVRSESDERIISPFSEESITNMLQNVNNSNSIAAPNVTLPTVPNGNGLLVVRTSLQSQPGSKDRRQSSRFFVDVNVQQENFTWSDRKSLQKITRENTERNSIIQPVENIGDHESQLHRCALHSKRVKDLYCVDDSCTEKNKFGCVLCFSSNAGSVHSFHQHHQISSMRQLNERIRKNRMLFEDFVAQKANTLSQSIAACVADTFSKNLKESLLEYAATLEDKEFIGYGEGDDEDDDDDDDDNSHSSSSSRQGSDEKNKQESSKADSNREGLLLLEKRGVIPKETAVTMYLASIEKQTKTRVQQVTQLWITQSYLGTFKSSAEFAAQFQLEKRRNLLAFARCFYHISSEVITVYLSSPQLLFESNELENFSSLKLHYIEDDLSRGLYQIGETNVIQAAKLSSDPVTAIAAMPSTDPTSAISIMTTASASANTPAGTISGNNILTVQQNSSRNNPPNIHKQSVSKQLKNGRGIQCFKSGSIYEGYFKNDMKFGEGKLISFNREVYIGTFKRNVRSGEGQLTYANGDIYKGLFSNDQCHGTGKRYYANEDTTYTGQWAKNQRHGKGQLIKAGQVVESGLYFDDHLKENSKK